MFLFLIALVEGQWIGGKPFSLYPHSLPLPLSPHLFPTQPGLLTIDSVDKWFSGWREIEFQVIPTVDPKVEGWRPFGI